MSANAIRAGGAFVELTAKDGKLQAGLQRAQGHLQTFEKAVTTMKKRLDGVGVGIMKMGRGINTFGNGIFAIGASIFGFAGALGGTLGMLSKKAIDVGDAYDKMSHRTGASVEWLSQMKYAAEQSGAEISNIEDSLKGLSETMAEGIQFNSGDGAKWLELINIDIMELAKLKPEEQFEAVADGLNAIQDQSIKTKAALGIFKGSAEKLLPMLDDYKKLKSEAVKLKLTVSTNEATRAAEVSSALGRLKASINSVSTSIGNALLPLIEKVSDFLTRNITPIISWTKANQGMIESIAKGVAIMGAMGAATMALGVILKPLAYAFSGAGLAVKGMAGIMGVAVSIAGKVLSNALGLGKGLLSFASASVKAIISIPSALAKIPAMFGAVKGGIIIAISAVTSAIGGIAGSIGGLFAAAFAGSIPAIGAVLAIGGAIALVIYNFDAFKQAIKDIFSSIKDLAVGFVSPFADAFSRITGIFREAKGEFVKLIGELKSVGMESLGAISDALRAGDVFGAIKIVLTTAKEMILSVAVVALETTNKLYMVIADVFDKIKYHFADAKMDFRVGMAIIVGWIDWAMAIVKSAFVGIINAIGGAIDTVINAFKANFIVLTNVAKRTWLRIKGIFGEDVEAKINASYDEENAALAKIGADQEKIRFWEEKPLSERFREGEKKEQNALNAAMEEKVKTKHEIAANSRERTGLTNAIEEWKNALEEAKRERKDAITAIRKPTEDGKTDGKSKSANVNRLTNIKLEPIIGSFSLKELSFSAPNDLSKQQLDATKKTNDKIDTTNRLLRNMDRGGNSALVFQ